MSRPSARSRKPGESASLSTDDSSPKLTPSPRSSHSSDGPALIDGPNAFELRTIAPHNESSSAAEDVEEDDLLPSERRASIDSVQSYELYTPDEDRAVLKKLDRRLVSFMALLYCLSFLDRSSEWSLHISAPEEVCIGVDSYDTRHRKLINRRHRKRTNSRPCG